MYYIEPADVVTPFLHPLPPLIVHITKRTSTSFLPKIFSLPNLSSGFFGMVCKVMLIFLTPVFFVLDYLFYLGLHSYLPRLPTPHVLITVSSVLLLGMSPGPVSSDWCVLL